jgi:DNA helicase-2/ATP-dependent DNA helicase PcrA
MELNFKPRKSQQKVLEYQGGTLGVSAVPGSGKTHILSALAAQIITSGKLEYDQEVLVVTLVNSAVDNFSSRISKFIKINGLVPNIGYRVRTLHALAYDIVKENPSLVGLENGFIIVDEKDAEQIRREIIQKWIQEHPYEIDELLIDGLDASKKRDVLERQLPILIDKFSIAFTRTAKDLRKTPDEIRKLFEPEISTVLQMGYDIFLGYQRALSVRGALDFDDLIAFGLTALENSPELLSRLRHKFPFILEDEAQDSSFLQERILGLLSSGNWVRVGDPNQAIFETFTTAKPEYLLNFIKKADNSVDLPESGRCQPSIIFMANALTQWANNAHPDFFCRDALTKPYILPTQLDDPQKNPEDNPHGVFLVDKPFRSEDELEAIAKSVEKWIELNKDSTVAVLSTTNKRGIDLINILKDRKIEYVEYLTSSTETRISANKMTSILEYLEDPTNKNRLNSVFSMFCTVFFPNLTPQNLNEIINALKLVDHPENIFEQNFPDITKNNEEQREIFSTFQLYLTRWTSAIILPVDQLVITIGQDLTRDPIELALFHKIAKYLRQGRLIDSKWGLKESIVELAKISKNERKFLGMGRDDVNFDPANYPGKVVVTTMHKAKGLEWDKVYLMSLNNYDFPSLQEGDSYYSEKFFIKGSINLEAEGVYQLKGLINKSDNTNSPGATLQARRDVVRERLRLLYVAITRAKRELAMTWNTGKGHQTISVPFAELKKIWNDKTS